MNAFLKTVGALALVACGSNHMPPPNFGTAQASISAADAVGARNQPQAQLHLKMARDELRQAQALAKDGDDDEASLMLERSKADAEIALMITRETTARNEADQSQRAVESLSQ